MITLRRGECIQVRGRSGRSVTAHSGRIWLTEEGNPQDIMLRPGETFLLTRAGSAVVEAFVESAISISPWMPSS
jgi:hypothetical protein